MRGDDFDPIAAINSDLTPDEIAVIESSTLAEDLETGLTLTERDMLDFEGQWHRFAGAKAEQIRIRFDMTEVRYYAELNALIDTEAALRFAPATVNRLRRLRDSRRRSSGE